MSQLYIKVVEDKVTEVWDTAPPANELDLWREAIEIRPEINPKRQGFTGHHFELDKTPAEIVWDPYDFSIEERQGSLKMRANYEYQEALKGLNRIRDADIIASIKTDFDAKITEIEAATTHDQLDLL